jgi:hypothetical protein
MNYTEIRIAGVNLRVPSIDVYGTTVIINGKWLKLGTVSDEDFQQGDVIKDPNLFLAKLRQEADLSADIFTFSQKLTDPSPRFPYYHEWDSIAIIPIKSFSDWWNNRVSKDLRRDVRRAAKLGVEVRPVSFNDEFVRGITEIYNETPVRQGKPFWHYRKSFESIKSESGTFMDRSDFLGAFWGGELIGFLKIVYVDGFARLLQIIGKIAHQDKRTTNALIANAVQLCETKHCSHLTYGNYRYHGIDSSLTAFKRRNGFEEILVPRYYIPLSLLGHFALRLHLHHGKDILMPGSVRRILALIRASIYRHITHGQIQRDLARSAKCD